MLQRASVEPRTLELLRELLAIPELAPFNLVGGTALSLKYGHRISEDLDLFSSIDFSKDELIGILSAKFHNFSFRENSLTVGLFCNINGVKVDLVKNHWFRLIDEVEVIEGIRMLGSRDLFAMKIFAILKRGQKKDFFDVCELLKRYSLKDGIAFYEQKYPEQRVLISIPSALTWFDDAENSPDPLSLNGTSWEDVKQSIRAAVREYLA